MDVETPVVVAPALVVTPPVVEAPPLPPTTTVAQDKAQKAREEETALTTAGQRRVNITWEVIQAAIALLTTLAFLYSKLVQIDAQAIDAAFFTIIGFYFGRTNHQRIGGVGLAVEQGR